MKIHNFWPIGTKLCTHIDIIKDPGLVVLEYKSRITAAVL